MNWAAFAGGFMIGFAVAYAVRGIVTEWRRDQRSIARHRERSLLGLPDRPARRLDAQGTARVHEAEYRPYRLHNDEQ